MAIDLLNRNNLENQHILNYNLNETPTNVNTKKIDLLEKKDYLIAMAEKS